LIQASRVVTSSVLDDLITSEGISVMVTSHDQEKRGAKAKGGNIECDENERERKGKE
jgi:hypothetical protein